MFLCAIILPCIADLLGEEYRIVEEGLGGRTTVVEDDLEGDKNGRRHLPMLLRSHRPLDLVIIMLGTNDMKHRFSMLPEDIAKGAEELGKIVETYDEMLANKEIACNLKASREQIIDDLNGVLSPIQRRVMKELLSHLDELDEHIRNLDDDIDRFMKQKDKDAAEAIQEIPGIANNSAQTVISVIGSVRL